jgi:Dyp-type peroxidase family
MYATTPGYPSNNRREVLQKHFLEEKRKQSGIAFPSAKTQDHILIIRFDLANAASHDTIRSGLKRLCILFERIDKGLNKIEVLSENGYISRLPLSNFNFSSTIGFGVGYFDKLNIDSRNRPKKLRRMPDHTGLLDSTKYILEQTDVIVQLCSTSADVNRRIYDNTSGTNTKRKSRNDFRYNKPPKKEIDIQNQALDIRTAIEDYAIITDIHAGFQRIDGRNLMGFNDGISNPDRLHNNIVWTTPEDETKKFSDGTYMVFQKILHDLEKWRKMDVKKQEEWIGRSKDTGLLLGTLSSSQDRKMGQDLQSDDPRTREVAMNRWKALFNEQRNPEARFYDSNQPRFKNIQLECPVWSHVRKANPRQADGVGKKLIFRRGYLFMDSGYNLESNSGLLFICFQRDIENGFEYIKRKFLNNENFPVPERRKNFNFAEMNKRRKKTLDSSNEISRDQLEVGALAGSSKESSRINRNLGVGTQITGREGLSGPSELGVYPRGEFPVTVSIGGGYYFVPPIPNKKISNITEQFFD